MIREPQHNEPAIRAIVSSGGTGGHLFPALAIAKQLQVARPGTEVLFIGAKGRMEMEKVPQNGFPIQGLWIAGFQRGAILKNLLLPFQILSSFCKSWWIIRQFNPDIAIGTGGYASAPLIYTAAKLKIPTLIQEQNFLPGLTNRLLANVVDKVCVVYQSLAQYFDQAKMIVTGNPVRSDLEDTAHNPQEARQNFGLETEKRTFLVLGGSLGARSINDALKTHAGKLNEEHIQGIWQTGKLYYDEICSHFGNAMPSNMAIQPFIDDMPQAYRAADLVIARAGAITLAELAYLGKPAILIPSPNVAEDHQAKNAHTLVQKDAALMIRDEALQEALLTNLRNTIQDAERLNELSENIKAFARPEATQNNVEAALKLIDERQKR